MKKRNPDPSATYRAALQHFQKGRFAQARMLLIDLHRALPKEPDVLRMLGAACSEMGRHTEATDYFLRVVELQPMPLDFFNYGKALQLMESFDKALRAHELGLRLQPFNVQLLQGRAITLRQLRRFDEAISAFREILRIEPNLIDARFNFAEVLFKVGQIKEAIVQLECADKAEPNNSSTISGIVRGKLSLCDWTGLKEYTTRLIEAVRSGSKADPFTLLTISDEPEVHLSAAKTWLDEVGTEGGPLNFPTPTSLAGGKLRIGYVSADFRNHATSYLMSGILEAHDRSKFEIIAISTGQNDASPMRERIVNSVDHFVDVRGLSSGEMTSRIRGFDLHIAVDLMGHTIDSCEKVFQSRVAPLQVNFLGYPGTTAVNEMDYIVVDQFIATPRVCRSFTEAPIIMPDCYQPNDPKRPRPDLSATRASHGLPEVGFVFCCFNNSGKVTPDLFGAWLRILSAVSGSVLWLYVTDETARANLRGEAVRRGISADRLIFASVLDQKDHLSRYLLADLFLDTFPYGAHTTASDALWMGCPVVTVAGNSFPSRVAGSLLRTVGLADLIVTSLDAYEHLAITIANEPELAAKYRRMLDECRQTTPLFDARLFVRHLEAAYIEIWRRRIAGSKRKAVDVLQLLAEQK